MSTHPLISICTTVKNRSLVRVDDRELRLFPNCVASVVRSVPDDIPVELVVTDWGSDDWPLEEWLDEYTGELQFTQSQLTGTFSRGLGRNRAADSARGRYLFFLDADCLICEPLIRRAYDVLREGNAYFPVLFSFRDAEHRSGWWRHQGFGNCVVSREDFGAIGGFPEYEYWGQEDLRFYESVCGVAEVVREEFDGFFHQWHPNDFEWKNRYGVASSYQEAKELEDHETSLAIRELRELIYADDSLILVDESQLVSQLQDAVRLFPFLERNGEYWGRPADSAQAIQEVERLRIVGASWIAFAWPAFWWLDHYSEFHQYLRRQFSVAIDNERLVVFDLRARTTPTSKPKLRGI